MADVDHYVPYMHFLDSPLQPGQGWHWSLGPINPGALSVTALPLPRAVSTGSGHSVLSVTAVSAVSHAVTQAPYVNATVRNIGQRPVEIIFVNVGVISG